MQMISRVNTKCIKWDMWEMIGGTNTDIPLWIADMDFAVEEKIVEAVQKRCAHPVFGYTFQDTAYVQAISDWYRKHHQVDVDVQAYVPTLNVLGAMQLIMKDIISPGDQVAMFTPIYPQFYNILETSEAVLSGIQIYADKPINWDEVEDKIKDAKVFLFCNPHNPLAKVWTADECMRLASLCHKYHVWLLSDEVHGDMAMFNNQYHCMVNYRDVHEQQIVFTSSAKTFNLAGLGGACLIIPDEDICKHMKKLLENYFQTEINCLSAEGIQAAYTYGERWLKDTKQYLEGNVQFLQNYLHANLPEIKCSNHQGTFLAWLDCRKWYEKDAEFVEKIKNEGHILIDNGQRYGNGGEGFIRMNIACDRALLEKAMENIKHIYKD